jgi:hypothetical protein
VCVLREETAGTRPPLQILPWPGKTLWGPDSGNPEVRGGTLVGSERDRLAMHDHVVASVRQA